MKSGLLWYDADPRKPIWDKIEEAAQRYHEKFGVPPNTCFVNPAALPQEASPAEPGGKKSAHGKTLTHVNSLKVATKPTILPNHIWLGLESREK